MVEKMQGSVLEAVCKCTFPDDKKLKYTASTTHLEVQKGILESENAECKSVSFRREFQDTSTDSQDDEERRITGRYFDVDSSGNKGANADKLQQIRRNVLQTGCRMSTFSTHWDPRGVEEETHAEYLRHFGESVKLDFIRSIKEATKTRDSTKDFVEEAAAHMTFCAQRSETFHGREDLVEKTTAYVHRKKGGGSPLVVFGDSGAGKTSLLAKFATAAREILRRKHPDGDPVLITRFCGTSPMSSSAPDLVQSILEQTTEVYGIQDLPSRSAGFKTLYTAWHNALKKASYHRPLVIAIDSIDQLNDQSNGRKDLDWLPGRLPAHVYLVLSTLPQVGGCFEALKKKATGCIPDGNFIQIEALSMGEASSIIQGWLHDAKRTLTGQQFSKLVQMGTDDSDERPSALRLKLLFDRASKWTSFQDPLDLPTSVQGLIGALFQELEADHGRTLVAHFCGVMGMSRHGLSENDMKDILSGDEDVLDQVFEYHKPTVRRLPDIVFARLLNSLRSYIVRRSAFQKTVLYWYHRQFWTAAGTRYISTEAEKVKYASLIADFFNNEMQARFPERNLVHQPLFYVSESGEYEFNETKLEQLPVAFISSGNQAAIDREIFNLSFLAAKIESGRGRHLLHEFSMMSQSTPRQEAYKRFITANLHILEKFPALIYQRARNVSDDNPMHQDIADMSSEVVLPWMKTHSMWKLVEHLNKPVGSDPCSMVIESPVRVTDVQFSKLHNVIITTNTKSSVVVWDPKTGNQICTVDYNSTLLALSTDQATLSQITFVAACSDGTVVVKDVQISGWEAKVVSQRRWRVFPEGTPRVAMALSHSSKHLLTATAKGKGSKVEDLKLWSLDKVPESELGAPAVLEPVQYTNRVSTTDKRQVTLKMSQMLFSPRDQFCAVVLGVHSANSPLAEKDLITIHDLNLDVVWMFKETIGVPKSVSIFLHPSEKNQPHIWYLLVTAMKALYLIRIDESQTDEEFGRYIWCIETKDPICNAVVTQKHPVILCGMFNDVMVWGLPKCSQTGAKPTRFLIDDVFKVSGRGKPITWEDHVGKEEAEIDQHGFLRGHNRTVRAICLSSDDSCCTISQDGQIRLWDLEAFYNFKTPDKHDRSLRTMTLSPDQRTVFSASLSRDIKIWESTTGRLKTTVFLPEELGAAVASMAVSPDSSLMAFLLIDKPTLHMTNVLPESDGFLNLAQVREIAIPVHAVSTGTGESGKHSVKFSSNGFWILGTIIRSRQAFLYDVKNERMTILAEHHSPIRSPNFSPDGTLVVTNSYGPETDLELTSPCQIYNVATGQHSTPQPSRKEDNFWDMLNVAFLSSGQQLVASTSQRSLQLRDFPSLDIVRTVENAHFRAMRFVAVVLSADATREFCVTSDHDGFLRVWTLPELRLLALFCNDVPINAIAAHCHADGCLYVCCGDIMGNVKILRVHEIQAKK